jgi:uncharacterized GH25 family protein
MRSVLKFTMPALALAVFLPLTAEAHRAWMLPSATVLSGTDKWVTVDAAISNDLFYFEHFPMKLDNLVTIGPDGAPAKVEHSNTGRYRSTFDVQLTQPGTYKFAVVNNSMFASYEENGETKRWRGSAEKFAQEVPANAKGLQVSKMHSRVELFVTSGKPSDTVLKPSGVGLELVPITHPNDLIVGEAASFSLTLNGKPAADIAVSLIPGGIRYRDNLNEIKVTTDKDGKFTTTFKEPGMYWLNATTGSSPRPAGGAAGSNVASKPAPGGPTAGGGPRPPAGDRASYTATIEVLPQ